MLLVLLASPTAALAETVVHQGAKVEISLPDGWKSQQDGDAMNVASPDGELMIVFVVLDSADAEKGFELIDKKLEESTGAIEWEEKPSNDKINGMDCEIWNGTAKDGTLHIEAVYIDTPADKSLGVYWFSTTESEAKFQKEIDLVVKGLKPVAAAPAPEPAPAK
jgi:predicted Zn-dependent protease